MDVQILRHQAQTIIELMLHFDLFVQRVSDHGIQIDVIVEPAAGVVGQRRHGVEQCQGIHVDAPRWDLIYPRRGLGKRLARQGVSDRRKA